MRNTYPVTYTAESDVITVSALSCQKEQDFIAISMLINSESSNQSWSSKKANYDNLTARVNSKHFPNNYIDVIYQTGQYDGIKTHRFSYSQAIYDSLLVWKPTNGYLYYYNPKIATDSLFINWSNKFQYEIIEDHKYFGK